MRRPTESELERLSVYDHFLWSDDYIGRWFFTNRFGDLTIYGMLHFTNNGLLEFARYSYYSDDDPIICHPLNPDDVELMARLDKLVK